MWKMLVDRLLAHTSVLSCSMSPCGEYLLFGTNIQKIMVFSLKSLSSDAQSEGHPDYVITVPNAKAIHTICVGQEFVFCGSGGFIFVYKWTSPENGFFIYCQSVPISSTFSTSSNEVTNLCFHSSDNTLLAGSSDGRIYIFSVDHNIVAQSVFLAHKATVHKLLFMTDHEFSSCSEDGFVRFWDRRISLRIDSSMPTSSFRPSSVGGLARPKLGSWLTALSFQPSDTNWFTVGGGPRLSLWNRRNGQHITIFQPDDCQDSWYSQTSTFYEIDRDPRIVAGGNSSVLYMWDPSGIILSSTDLADPPKTRIGHILVTSSFELPYTNDMLKPNHSSILVVGGCGPTLRIVSKLGYPLGSLRLT